MKSFYNIITLIFIAISFIAISFITNAQTLKTGTTAAQVLKFNVGPRAIGMGGAFTAISNDITALYWNPGGTANIQMNEAVFNHTSLFADVRHDYA
ncbi:MAG: UPF0164 family protein, partial [Ignavibacteria bacterium]